MKVDSEDIGVKHAVVRRKRLLLSISSSSQRGVAKDSWTYRCGKVGPFGSLEGTLRYVCSGLCTASP